jgi:acyl-CoA thioesterase
MTPKERAEKACHAMWDNDQSSKWFGMELGEVDEGKAVMTLKVMPHHCNGHAICHGGVIFALADSTFAFACNSRNQSTVAQHNMISFLAPGKEGDLLTAVAEERYIKGRSGIYDITVTNQDGTRIAEMRGMSRAIPGTLFEEEPK